MARLSILDASVAIALARGAANVDDGVQCGERDAHVRWVGGHARGRSAEDRVVAVEALDRVTVLARATSRAIPTAEQIWPGVQ